MRSSAGSPPTGPLSGQRVPTAVAGAGHRLRCSEPPGVCTVLTRGKVAHGNKYRGAATTLKERNRLLNLEELSLWLLRKAWLHLSPLSSPRGKTEPSYPTTLRVWESPSHVRLFVRPWPALPGSAVLGVLQARRLSGVPGPPPGHLPEPGLEPASLSSPALAGGLLNTAPPGSPRSGAVCKCVRVTPKIKIGKTTWPPLRFSLRSRLRGAAP